jgi:putative FmdB family regulatory protein
MPIYEHECPNCGLKMEVYRNISECNDVIICTSCGSKCNKLISKMNVHVFESQVIGATLTDKDGNDVNQFVKNKSELTDAINRYNDTKRASMTGKVAILE